MIELSDLEQEYQRLTQQQQYNPNVMPFGKHKGKLLSKVPSGYIRWALENCDLRSDLRDAILAVLARRRA